MTGNKWYDCLGLPLNADLETVRRRYKQLAKEFHPDRNKNPGAAEKFIEIKTAFDMIVSRKAIIQTLQQQPVKTKAQTEQEKRAAEFEKAVRAHLRKKEKEKQELNQLIHKLRSGIFLWQSRIVASVSGIILICLLLDLFLPRQIEKEIATRISKEMYNSSRGNTVMLIETLRGKKLFLADFDVDAFNYFPRFEIHHTRIFKHPARVVVNNGEISQYIPVHFTIYWAQFLFYPLLIAPIFFHFYKGNNSIFVTGNYFSRYVVGGLILLFLLTENRLIHLVSLGNF